MENLTNKEIAELLKELKTELLKIDISDNLKKIKQELQLLKKEVDNETDLERDKNRPD